ncbi:MAG: hypothetical protein ACYTE3_17840, partial [Planctomycetota bacterium]|jgi:hypothetical protein
MAALLVSIWPLTVIARAPRAFFLNIVKIPTLYGQWLREIGMVFDKLALTLSCLTKPGYLVLIVLTVCLYLAVFFQCRNLKIENSRMPILAFLLPIAFFVIALIPPTMWSQYHAIPVPFLIISLAFPLRHLRETLVATGSSSRLQIVRVLLALCVLITLVSPSMGLHPMLPSSHVPSYHTVIARILKLRDLQNWVPLEVHRVSRDIAEKTREPKLVLTLAPLFALEGGCEIYTQLSCGSVIYRAADALSASDRAITNTVGQKAIANLIDERPPSAVMLGMERGKLASLEAPLKNATRADWEREDYKFGPTVYFRP